MYDYVHGNPVNFVDPLGLGLSKKKRQKSQDDEEASDEEKPNQDAAAGEGEAVGQPKSGTKEPPTWVETGVSIGRGYIKGSTLWETVTTSHVFIIIDGKMYGFYSAEYRNPTPEGGPLGRAVEIAHGKGVVDIDTGACPLQARQQTKEGGVYGLPYPVRVYSGDIDPDTFKAGVVKWVQAQRALSKEGKLTYDVATFNCADWARQAVVQGAKAAGGTMESVSESWQPWAWEPWPMSLPQGKTYVPRPDDLKAIGDAYDAIYNEWR